MPIYRCNLFFELLKRGWSETYFTPNLANPEVALNTTERLVAPRVALLAAPLTAIAPRLTEIRISDVDVQRDSLVKAIAPADGTANGGPAGDCLPINVALLMRLNSGSLYRRQLYIRGIPAQLSNQQGEYKPNADYNTKLDAFFTALRINSFGIYAWLKPTAPVRPLKAILGVQNLPGGVTIETPGHGLINNDQIRVQSCPGTQGVRGNWHVHVIDDQHYSLVGAPPYTGVYIGGGLWYKRIQDTVIFTDMNVEGLTHHDTGRPFDSPRGRRRRPARV